MLSGPLPQSSLAILAAVILLLALPCTSQSIPPAQPTTQPTSPARPQPPSAHRAAVTLDAGKLAVTADNSSLNQILRDIARLTGMTITGGVLDERVFGTYGPADTSTVLSALLNGTGSNMLLIQDSQQAPQQLILTPRQGGASPPSPTALRDPGEADLPPQLAPRTSRQLPTPQPQPAFNGALPAAPAPISASSIPAATVQTPASTNETSTQPSTDAPTPPPPNATTEESPNGVKTPQQIYDQLIKLQQQQAKPPSNPPLAPICHSRRKPASALAVA